MVARGRPVAILVDDVHWSDRASLRFLAYLVARLTELPIALIVALRPGEDLADVTALSALQNAPALTLLRPAPLSERGIEALVRAAFPDADPAFVRACNHGAGGNPFLITELLCQMRAERRLADAVTAARLAELAPSVIVDSVVARLGAMSPESRAPQPRWPCSETVRRLPMQRDLPGSKQVQHPYPPMPWRRSSSCIRECRFHSFTR